jgi:uncharacterized protein (TIGR02996 family)
MIALLTEHEGFLRAIFDAPNQDTPRLMYADFLEETAEYMPPPHHDAAAARADLIRVQCELSRLGHPEPARGSTLHCRRLARREEELKRWIVDVTGTWWDRIATYHRGFPPPERAAQIGLAELYDEAEFRSATVTDRPQWFGATGLRVTGSPAVSAAPFEVLFGCPAFARVTEFDFRGQGKWVRSESVSLNPYVVSVSAEFVHQPGVTDAGVAALSRCRGAQRLTALSLAGNELGNGSASALVKSPHLLNLKRLEVLNGNRLGPRAIRQLVDRFGEDVVV